MAKATPTVPTLEIPAAVPVAEGSVVPIEIAEQAPTAVVPLAPEAVTSEPAAGVGEVILAQAPAVQPDAALDVLKAVRDDIVRHGFEALGRVRNRLDAFLEGQA